ncbi:MAG: serine/threonine-protein phosphatase 6 regulatory ankyrin repeat subunit C-like, partial [Pedosphaera sp.]|nr:serine/threonine-protein phosphatase 6 regulatory ankyrin repeat subunit C-like [Pedosphaera sp.]
EAVDGSGRTTLHWAAAMGQAEVVRWLLAAQTPGFVQSRDHDTPLDLAALNKHQEVVVALLAYLRTAGKDGGILTPSLHGAVKGGDKAIIEKILAAGAEVNQTDGHGTTPLYLAVEAGNTEVVDLLLAHKAQADTPTLAGDTPLKSAARNGHPEIVRLLMATTRLKQANQQRVTTPLHEAVAHRNDAVVEELLKGGASVDARDENGNTPFHIAAQHNALELMELLLAHGANVNAEDGEGNTALHYEARSGTQWDEEGGEWDANRGPKPTWVRYAGNTGNFLLDHGARAQATNALGETALHFFGKRRESGSGAISNEEGLVKLLLQHGADINARDLGGQTPLHVAALNGSDTVLQVLLTHGAEVNARDNEGRTPWLAAAGADWKRGDSPEAVTFQVLANNKADLQAMDIHGNTALHEAAKADYFRAVEALRALGLNAGATNRLGQTPLALALANNSVFSVPKLLPNGVTVDIFEAARVGDQTAIKALLTFDRQLVNLTNWFGATPLLVAAQNGHVEVAQLLLAYQASVHARDPMGRTALHLAYLNGSKPLIELLINNHADVEAKDWSGKKPADLKRPAPAAAARRRRAGELVSRYWVWLPIVVIVAATPWIWHQRRHHFVSPSPFPKP